MSRERKGFVVSLVTATVQYTDANGQQHKFSKAANAQAADSTKNLKDAQKQALKIRHAEQIIRDTIAELKKTGATKCKGSIKSRLYARVGYTNQHGRRQDVVRTADSLTHARKLIRKILLDLDNDGGRAQDAERMTFADLADHFDSHYLKPAEYVGGRKVDGVRSLKSAQSAVKSLRRHFGEHRLQRITYGDIRSYRANKLKEPTPSDVARHKREVELDPNAEVHVTRTIGTVNRELAKLRRMLNVAQREGWIRKNPFAGGDSLISVADEKKRERILTREEERRLLAACSISSRIHLRPIVIAALDTGMRKGELLTLRWRNVNFERNVIQIDSFNTKTQKARELSITTRLNLELAKLWEQSTRDPAARCFGIVDNVKRSFDAARKAAGLTDVRFHDLRHTAATRLVGAHMPLSEVGRILGHTQANTTYRYVNANAETAKRAAAALNAFNAESEVMLVQAFDVLN